MASTYVLAAPVSEAGMSEAVAGGGYPVADSSECEADAVRLFVLQRATDVLPRSLDFDRYCHGIRRC